ncbi:MAG: hypothetical protein RQ741_04050 [Wenzhouxiangellaceae bacterium]|nr:hypothetical protein [Wenzhouxiangellaceae bacterium]
MKMIKAVTASFVLLFALGAFGQDAAWSPALEVLDSESLDRLPISAQLSTPLSSRPRLAVALAPSQALQPEPGSELPFAERQMFSWSLEAWEMNTASLAHIQCSRATQTIETFLVEDCRFVDQPLPDNSANLVQIQGQWMTAPGLSVAAGLFAGSDLDSSARIPGLELGGINTGLPQLSEQVQGANMNISFGLRMGRVGNLLLDLQLERYRRKPESFALQNGIASLVDIEPSLLGRTSPYQGTSGYQNAGQLGVGWRGGQFGADVTGQYQELPYWAGEQLQGEGFRSFDIEFSWKAPARSSIVVGVSNVLNRLPGAVSSAADQSVEETVDGIYGRIPYVRYKHDL